MLFHKGIRTLKSWSQLGTKRKRKKSPVKSSQGRKGGRARKRAKEVTPTFDEEDEEDDDDDEGDDLSPQEVATIRRSLLQLLQDFLQVLQRYSLRTCGESCLLALQVLVDLSKQDPEVFEPDFDHYDDFESDASMPALAFKGLSRLCNEMHGDVSTTVTTIFKHLMPSLLMLVGDNKGVAAQTIPRAVVVIKDHALAYVCHLIQRFGEAAHTPARTLVQHLCIKVPDKADYRSRVALVVVTLLKQLPPLPYAKLIEWFYKFSRNEKTSYRGFAVDIVAMLLNEKEKDLDETVPPEISGFTSHVFLIKMILMRCSDVAPTVRTRAISAFANCVQSEDTGITAAIRDTVTPRIVGKQPLSRVIPTPDAADRQKMTTDVDESDKAEDPNNNADKAAIDKAMNGGGNVTPVASAPISGDTPGAVQLLSAMDISLYDGQGVTSMIRRRALDEKVGVRKAAVQALESIIVLDPLNFNLEDLETIHNRCRDPALSVRKQAMLSLTDLLQAIPLNSKIQWAWLDGVLPLVLDRESSISTKCIDILEDNILGNVTPYTRSTEDCHDMVWQMLDVLASVKGVELRRYVQKAFQHLTKEKRLKSNLMSSLITHIATKNNTATWMLLSEMAPSVNKFKPDIVLDYWQDHAKLAGSEEYMTVERVLNVIGCIAQQLPSQKIKSLTEDLKERLVKFDLPPELISVTINTLSKLHTADEQAVSQGRKDMTKWCSDLLKVSDVYLSQIILNETADGPLDENLIVCHLFTIGEIAQLCPNSTPKRVFMLIQSLIAAPCISTLDGSSQQDTDSASQENPGSQNRTSPGTSQGQASQGDSQEPATQGITGTQVLSQFSGSNMPTRVRAHAFITLGKLCLQNETLAKKVVPAMARELETSTDPAIRNNVVIIMCDLCVRYTTLINNYVTNIACCVKDENALVRKQTLTLITHLLQEDYLKWKGALFYRFIMGLVDEVKEIREFTEFCLVHLLIQRNPGMFFQHFIECIFHFNAYEGHNVYNKFAQSDKEKKMFSLKGKENAGKRMTIYRFLLEHMTDENRFNLSGKLVQDILGTMAEGDLVVDVDSSPLLQDTLAILASKEIKLSSMKSKPPEEIYDEQEAATALVEKAKKAIITEIMRKNLIENIVPVVIALKHMLEKKLSPLQKDLMMYLRELMKDYKSEVKDIMAADKQLAMEIEFDLRKFEEQLVAGIEAQKLVTPLAMRRSVAMTGTPAVRRNLPRTPRAPATGERMLGSTGQTRDGVLTPGPGQATGGRTVATPKNATPVMTLTGSVIRTPRNVQLSSVAIMNSAKKSMERARRLSAIKKDHLPRRESPLVTNVSAANRPSPMSPQGSNSDGKLKLLSVQRAISTPDRTIMNITFNPGEVTMAPPSPIPRLTRSKRRAGSDGELSFVLQQKIIDSQQKTKKSHHKTPQEEIGSDEDRPMLLCLMSPEKPGPKPRMWNLKSPSQASGASDAAQEKIQAGSSEDLTDKNSGSEGSMETSGSGRATRRATRRTSRKK
ncbi:condensin-2 complex subunit D3-L-like [Lineus longissimus]|uniref:condensin-2 complex subunit D3-L-like n=1 Tax=Lineus longissimus TaxID=88925 RepID=UPI00315C740D